MWSRHGPVLSATVSGLGLCEYGPIPPLAASALEARDLPASGERRSLLCLALAAPRVPKRARSAQKGALASVMFHVAAISIVMSLTAWSRSNSRHTAESSTQVSTQVPRLVFLLQPGPSGGGGGGGRKQPQSPSRAQASAVARPMPCAAAVTRIVLFWSLLEVICSLRHVGVTSRSSPLMRTRTGFLSRALSATIS